MMQFQDAPLLTMLPDGKRMNLRHGPIDLVIEATGAKDEVEMAYRQAVAAFDGLLGQIAGELDQLRKPINGMHPVVTGDVAKAMEQATRRIARDTFATPMIAVAGAVADHILKQMNCGRDLAKAYVNNGGDIALFLAENESFDIGVCANPLTGAMGSIAHICESRKVGGVATSGWRGRSHSLGIADAITVLADCAATADVAATLIANAVDLPGHEAITRIAANVLAPDSDLDDRSVTINVGDLSSADAKKALMAGENLAQSMIDAGLIVAVYGSLQAESFTLEAHDEKSLRPSPPVQNIMEVTHA